ncbi:MAG: ABC transporter permease [Opitutaceae bacterium]|nr:ABC transporter permease [Opitutaceae bacterium]
MSTATHVHPLIGFAGKTLTITELELRKLRHDFTDVITRAIQPALWLLLFGSVFAQLRLVPAGDIPYRDFMAPGILAQGVLFTAIFYGIGIIWERDLGVAQKYLASPAPRTALVLGKALSASLRALIQTVFIYTLSVILGVHVDWHPTALLGVITVVIFGAALFSSFSFIIACLVKTRERFMGIGQILTMPLFFASNAIYPISLMPPWLQVLAHLNPLTYIVDALRALMLAHGTSHLGLPLDFAVIILTTLLVVWIGSRVYPRIVR